MRIAIADDQAEDRNNLIRLLKRYCASHSLDAEFTCFSSSEALLSQFAPGKFQLVFLDIYMGRINGMDAARKLRQSDADCQIIFFTVSQTHAVASYEVRAAWYLVKPVEYQRLEVAMDTVCSTLMQDQRHIMLHSMGIEIRLPMRNILFLDCAEEHTQLHLKDRIIITDELARDMIAALTQDERFLLCNRNVVVNLDWVEQALEDDFLLKNGLIVPIRQRGRASIKKAYLTWSLRGMRNEVNQ